MRKWLGTGAPEIVLAAVVLVGGIRVWYAFRDRRPAPPTAGSPSGPLPSLRQGEAASSDSSLFGRAIARERLAEETLHERPGRDPFRSEARAQPSSREPAAATPSAPRSGTYSIPRVARQTGEGASARVVLDFGRSESRPLAAGEAERGWKILSIETSRVFVEGDGVIYTLPIR
jgi:hypothetical protein